MVIGDVVLYIPHSEMECMDLLNRLAVCRNCTSFSKPDLFGNGTCKSLGGREVGRDMSCEEFGGNNTVNYWVDKLVAIMCDLDPNINDFTRQLNYHQKMGTDYEFLGLERP